MFSLGSPAVLTQSAASLGATITDYSALTTSDYRLKYDGTNYTLTRLSDGNQTTFATFPQTVDGVTYALTAPLPPPAANDSFLIQPTRNGASALSVLFSDPRLVAAAAPVRTSSSLSNTGTAQVSAGSVNAAYPATPLAAAQALTYASATGTFSGFPAGSPVTVTAGGISTTYAAGTPVPYTSGATLSWDGMDLQVTGAPANGDTFTVSPNTGATGDNRNALALAALQTTQLLGGSTVQQAYGALTAMVGNKAHQMQVASSAQASLVKQVQAASDSVSGVNLDEEAADLLRYQQAYQAAGKVFGIASTLFDTILNLQH
jgi:flagellar hook-associated protein 1 FlgK